MAILALTRAAAAAGNAMGGGHHLRVEIGRHYQRDDLSWLV